MTTGDSNFARFQRVNRKLREAAELALEAGIGLKVFADVAGEQYELARDLRVADQSRVMVGTRIVEPYRADELGSEAT